MLCCSVFSCLLFSSCLLFATNPLCQLSLRLKSPKSPKVSASPALISTTALPLLLFTPRFTPPTPQCSEHCYAHVHSNSHSHTPSHHLEQCPPQLQQNSKSKSSPQVTVRLTHNQVNSSPSTTPVLSPTVRSSTLPLIEISHSNSELVKVWSFKVGIKVSLSSPSVRRQDSPFLPSWLTVTEVSQVSSHQCLPSSLTLNCSRSIDFLSLIYIYIYSIHYTIY